MWAVKHRISLKISSQRKPLLFQALMWHAGVFHVFLAQAGGGVTDHVEGHRVGAEGSALS